LTTKHTKSLINTKSLKNTHHTYANGPSQIKPSILNGSLNINSSHGLYKTTPNHNIPPLTQYYKTKQHQYYSTLLLKHFHPTQPKDTKFITPALSLPLIHLSIQECNPDKDILTHTPTIAIQHTKLIFMIILACISLPYLLLDYIGYGFNIKPHSTTPPTSPLLYNLLKLNWFGSITSRNPDYPKMTH
jgi:hypothetical protein